MKNSESKSAKQIADKANAEPKLILECPPELGPVARQEWDRILRDIPETVELKSCDRIQLVIYCNSYVLYLEAAEALAKFGSVVKSPNGFPVQSPYVSIAHQEVATMLRIANDFGFTPASRNRFPWRSGTDALELQSMEILR